MKPEPDCPASHPHHQRNWAHWRCPFCDSPLALDLRADDAGPGCKKLHSDDQLRCTSPTCQFAGLGNFVSRLVATRGHNKPCDRCQARGHVGGVPCVHCSGRGYAAPRGRLACA